MNTILGTVPASKLGRTLPHEHILVGSLDMRMAFGDRWYDRKKLVELAVKEIAQVRDEYGITTIIDGTTADTCRDLELIKEVALETGVNIPYCTGLYHSDIISYNKKIPEEFAKYFISECLEGSSRPDGSTGESKPAFLKCAVGEIGMTDINRVCVTAMAIAQRETGLPLFCHNVHRAKTADAQVEVFREYGADLNKVIIGHASDCTDVDYLETFLKLGCHLSFDRIGPHQDNNLAHATTVKALIDRGWINRITLSHDHCVYLDFGKANFEKTYAAGPYGLRLDFTYISRCFLDRLREHGVTEEQIDTMMIANPAKLYGNE